MEDITYRFPRPLERLSLKSINPEVSNVFLIGVIVAKQPPKIFNREGEINRGVWNFTFRDSIRDYINVTFWGEESTVLQLNTQFHVGDVVEVVKPTVSLRISGDSSERYTPEVTSPYKLTLSESSQILRHIGHDQNTFSNLLKYPTKPLARFTSLNNIQQQLGCSRSEKIEDVDVLVAVKYVADVRNVITKHSGEIKQVRDVTMFDQTCQNARMSIWDDEWINRANTWVPRETILFLTNTRAQWCPYNRCVLLKQTVRTVITENPFGNEANILKIYAMTAPLKAIDVVESIKTAIPDPKVIQNIMNIEQIQSKIVVGNESGVTNSEPYFTVLLHAVVNDMQLDSPYTILKFCKTCKSSINVSTNICNGSSCVPNEFDFKFNVRVSLSDHTGTIRKCTLSGAEAEKVFNRTAEEFANFNEEERYVLKWKFLLERFAVRLIIFKDLGRAPMISILDMSEVSPLEVASMLS